jgi:L-seryl-tRNA(Ser) seleniumtransferase
MMKVSKEDMVAQLAAVERFVRLDHQAEVREWERRIGVIEEAVRDIPSVHCERLVPPIANHVPHLILTWDEQRVKTTGERFTRTLRESNPPILLGRVPGTGTRGVVISVFTLQEGEDKIVAERVADILRRAAMRK